MKGLIHGYGWTGRAKLYGYLNWGNWLKSSWKPIKAKYTLHSYPICMQVGRGHDQKGWIGFLGRDSENNAAHCPKRKIGKFWTDWLTAMPAYHAICVYTAKKCDHIRETYLPILSNIRKLKKERKTAASMRIWVQNTVELNPILSGLWRACQAYYMVTFDQFLVAHTRIYTLLYQSVSPSVCHIFEKSMFFVFFHGHFSRCRWEILLCRRFVVLL